MRDDWSDGTTGDDGKQGSNAVRPMAWDDLMKPPNNKNSLLENRALERGQAMLVFGPSGIGKTIGQLQMCSSWAAGIAGLHIAPDHPLKIAILQTEDSQDDMREYCSSILSQPCFTPERIALVKQNLLIMEPIPGGSLKHLESLLNHVAVEFKPDLISLNPLLAFCAADYTRELGAILYQVIDPIIKTHQIGFQGVHHTPKTIRKDTSNLSAFDYQYLAAGDARIANWPRLSLQIDPVAASPVLTACFRITKRWQRIRWLNERGEPTRERFIKHSASTIWWDDAFADEAEEARASEQPMKILEILPPPSEPGIIRDEVRIRVKNKFNAGRDKADAWLNIGVHHTKMIDRYEESTANNRKMALFRRIYE